MAFENEDHSYDGTYDTKAVPGDPIAVLRQLAAQVRAHGIREIDGRVIVDSSLFADPGPENGTGAVVSPAVVNDNLVDVTVTPGVHTGDPVVLSVSPQTPYARFVSEARTGGAGSEPTIDLSKDHREADGSHTITVTGTMPAGKPILYTYRVQHPAGFAQMAFAIALRDEGVSVDTPEGASPFDRTTAAASYVPANVVAQHVSPPLAQDVYVTLKVSDNLHAALMPYMWGIYVAHAQTDQLQAGFKQEHALLTRAGLDLNGAAQQDGLGSFSRGPRVNRGSALCFTVYRRWASTERSSTFRTVRRRTATCTPRRELGVRTTS
jgi:D-alanyl-D-alanine carboxypeptidase/D-alanyl-D-alanine-endopeptidase (penicillin-binding protein 4)